MKTSNSSIILGIGNDIIELERIRQSFDRHGYRFLTKLFSEQEQDYCLKHKDPIPHLAGRFAAKEAIVKALGTGFGEHASWQDLEIINDTLGKPQVHVSKTLESKLESSTILISISHCQLYVTAMAIWTKT
ncbi:MAG: holo-ACP synthase [Chlamydiae bacterium]|nr:holo-ACP synthase [Chlamydiota bacterium]